MAETNLSTTVASLVVSMNALKAQAKNINQLSLKAEAIVDSDELIIYTPSSNLTEKTKASSFLRPSNIGVAGGLVGLNANLLIDTQYLPSYVDDVIDGYLLSNVFYADASHTAPLVGESSKIYLDLTTSNWKTYRWSGAVYIEVSSGDLLYDLTPQLGGDLDLNSHTINGIGNIAITGNMSATGNIGIGTTAPTQKLDVSGNININTNGTSALFSTYKGANSDGYNIFIGGGGLSSAGVVGETYKGSRNTANGYQSLYSNTTGYYNIANGYRSLYLNTTGYYNTANGYQSLRYNTTGYQNTANGYESLYYNTTGYNNTANGYASLFSNTTGYQNTANGFQSLVSNTTGYNNTANGYLSLYFNTTGNTNTANGYLSLYYNTTGSNNTSLGYNSGRYIADGTTGRTTGDNGLYLGYNSKASADGTDNEIVIGYNAIGKGSNTATYGNTSMTKHIFESGNVGIGTTAPATTLDVVSINANPLRIYRNSGNSSIQIQNNATSGYVGLNTSNNIALGFVLDQANAPFQITSSGNVGIGTTGPTEKLEVNGNIKATGYKTGTETGITTTQTVVSDTRMSSGQLQKKTRLLTYTNGLLTAQGAESDWTNTSDI